MIRLGMEEDGQIDVSAIFQGFNISQYEDYSNRSDFILKPRTFVTIVTKLDLHLVPVICSVGILGNATSFIVLVCTYLRRTSASIYLAALSLADLAFLVAVMLSWGPESGSKLDLHNGLCQLTVYIKYLSYFLSVWYIVSFTTERYIAVHFPLKRSHLCTAKRAKIIVIALAVIGGLLYALVIWSYGIMRVGLHPLKPGVVLCAPRAPYTRLVSCLHNIDTVITLIVPFCLIVVMNIKIAHKVWNFYRQRKSMTSSNSGTHVTGSGRSRHSSNSGSGSGMHRSSLRCQSNSQHVVHGSGTPRGAGQQPSQVRVTKMLLVISTAFLLMHLPRHTARAYTFIREMIEGSAYRPSLDFIMWAKLFILLYYLNFALNLFLYSVCGRSFRKASVWLKDRIVHRVSDLADRAFHRRYYGQRYGASERLVRLRALMHLDGEERRKTATPHVAVRPAEPLPLV